MRVLLARFIVVVLVTMLCFLYGYWRVGNDISYRLPLSLSGTDVSADGVVESVSQKDERQTLVIRLMSVESVSDNGAETKNIVRKLRRVRLGYRGDIPVKPGDHLGFVARLKAFRAFSNPGSFDYEALMLIRETDAGGYIRNVEDYIPGESGTDIWRYQILENAKNLPGYAGRFIPALLFGVSEDILPDEWDLLRKSGAVHLVVVSGLHLGFWLLLCGLLLRLLFSAGVSVLGRNFQADRWLQPVLLMSLIGAYAWLTGWGTSVQRAYAMMLIAMIGWMLSRTVPVAVTYASAVLLVLLWQPLIFTSSGFWYSFIAVLVLLTGFAGRKKSSDLLKNDVLLRPQFLLVIGMTPLFWYFGQPQSIQAFLFNLVAVPLLGLLVLPLSLLVWLTENSMLIEWFNSLLSAAFASMEWLSDGQSGLVFRPTGIWLVLLWFFILIVIMPSGFPYRTPVVLSLVVFVLIQPEERPESVYVLDVGQGLSVYGHSVGDSWLYDTGASFPSGFSLARSVIIPAMSSEGANDLSRMIVSHSDNDHAGGADIVRRNVIVGNLYAGQPEDDWSNCHQNSEWHSGGSELMWRFLPLPDRFISDNNRSCVKQIRMSGVTILLAGDIDRKAERYLVQHYGHSLKSDVLVVAHHGSKTSSSEDFIQLVRPLYAVVSSGFRNRFGHPHSSVVGRFHRNDVRVFNTAEDGALRIRTGEYPDVTRWSDTRHAFWRQM